MSWVFQHSQARLGARLVLLAIANHADEHGRNSWASVGSLGEESHLCRRETQYALRELEQAGEIVQVATSPNRTHVYELPGMADLWASEPSSSEGAILAPAESAPRKPFALRAQNTTKEGATVAHEPSLTTHNRQRNTITIAFGAFWEAYPRKVGKPKARTAYDRALKRSDAATILAAAKRYRDDPNRMAEFTAHPTTWLNRDGWDDEPLPGTGTRQRPDPPRPLTDGEAYAIIEGEFGDRPS